MSIKSLTLQGTTKGSTEGISLSGFKHSSVLLTCASLLFKNTVHFLNAPLKIRDIEVLTDYIKNSGGIIHRDYLQSSLSISSEKFMYDPTFPIPNQNVHGTLYLFPVLLSYNQQVMFPSAGGCQIGTEGTRPTNHIIEVCKLFGACFFNKDNHLYGKWDKKADVEIDILKLTGVAIDSPFVSGATKTAILMAAASGYSTTIKNHYCKQDVLDLLKFLKKQGLDISVQQNSIIIKTKNVNIPKITTHEIPPDSIEAVTYIASSFFLKTALTIKTTRLYELLEDIKDEIATFKQMGFKFSIEASSAMKIFPPIKIKSQDITITSATMYSDSQPFFLCLNIFGDREAKIVDKVWPRRFHIAKELTKLNAQFEPIEDGIIIIPSKLKVLDNVLNSHDLRGFVGQFILSSSLQEMIIINDFHHVYRGYNNFIDSFQQIGFIFEANQNA